ncbi:MAG: glycosyltransferase [Candidatus Margulisiibacteriota bacterium]|nr:MAG: hypothetical protein A2X43_02405 [Candidatus Margulisbacteria bacterium GWD2_39_127]OGI01181.1 MAG: hypothetical protein A2X42_06080 [Candidatus Margulisbacteria bacterium GWF2_38_17]OGI09816.1 MAG: hypothetical protein A2X41_09800 [Candidatus Margulisbacteria bacterium GWE2_39_32]PZM78405.1 MAG: glycosyltransferase [Candidatus Margulisiibacteriota bacterium]HAR62376.1 glycosyltransferase [Candidatus Margulisiibacteriota bacterium]
MTVSNAYNYELSVFIPARDESASLQKVLKKIESAFESLNLKSGEIIFVDDGSTDDSARILKDLKSSYKLKIVTHKKSLGLTAAMKSGFSVAEGEYLIFLPGDLESDPESDIPILYSKLQEGFDVVSGYRQGRKDGKVLASRVYNFVSRKLFHLDLHDMNWIKGFRLEVLRDIELRSDWHRFIIMIAADMGYSVAEVPVSWHPRIGGRSKFGFLRIPISFFDVLALKFLLMFRKKPMLFYGTVAFSMLFGGVMIGIVLVSLWLLKGVQIRPFLQLAFFLLLSGMFILMVGFLAEQIASLQDRVDKLCKSCEDRCPK